jgi:hypothetical protein
MGTLLSSLVTYSIICIIVIVFILKYINTYMKIYEILSESVLLEFEQRSLLYHGVPKGTIVASILKSGFIKPMEPFEADEEITGETDPVISFSRNQYLRFPYGVAVAQFVVDRGALKQAGYKVVPKIGAMMGHKEETEERVYKPIPVRPPFVVAIQIDPSITVPKQVYKRAKELGVPVVKWKEITPVQQPKQQSQDSEKKSKDYPYTNPEYIWTSEFNEREPNGEIHARGNIGYYDKYIIEKLPSRQEADKLANLMKARIKQGLSIDDLITDAPPDPESSYKSTKNWSKGYRILRPGEPGYEKL